MEEKGGFFGGLGKMAGKIVGSDKFLEFVKDSNLGDLINVALQTPMVREGLMEKLTELTTDIKERYDVREWKWWTEREQNKVIVQLYIDGEDKKKDFVAHFKKFMEDLKGKFGSGFDAFMVFYKVGSIGAHIRDDGVEIELVTERVDDLQATILELATAKDTYQEEGEGEMKDEG
jgi:hypothetical protein